MTGFQKALVTLLEQTGLPVHLSGTVAPLPQFPYITLAVSAPAFSRDSLVTATAWLFGPTANFDRLQLADTVRSLIPESGVMLRYDGGLSVIHRGSGDFVSLITDSTEPVALGLRIRLAATSYDT